MNEYINKIKRNHGFKSIERYEKIEEIIKQGTDIESILAEEIYNDATTSSENKKILQEIIDSKLEIHLERTGRTLAERINILFDYFNENERDPTIGMAKDGFDRLISDLKNFDKRFEELTKSKFELETSIPFNADVLIGCEFNFR